MGKAFLTSYIVCSLRMSHDKEESDQGRAAQFALTPHQLSNRKLRGDGFVLGQSPILMVQAPFYNILTT
jgi:hypothetical protein